MGEIFLIALGLMLVFEGLLPFLSPGRWRQVFAQVLSLNDGQLRFMGLCSMLIGVLLLSIFGS
jgi:uncharacterized protein